MFSFWFCSFLDVMLTYKSCRIHGKLEVSMIILWTYICFYILYFVKLFFSSEVMLFPTYLQEKGGWMGFSDTWHYSHIPIFLSHCISCCYTYCGCFTSIYLDVLFLHFHIWFKTHLFSWPSFFFPPEKIQAPFLALTSTDRYLVKWELGYGRAVPYELY